MSEYQYVVFRAVDGPLTDEQLAFAEAQSSRADVSRWSMSVEYHYSSFRGDVDGLLRRGYDVYLQHSNYGEREIKLRLPAGMPFAKSAWSKYVDGERLIWKKDAKSSGGIITVRPFHEAGDHDEIWDTEEYLDAAIRIRERLISGDLRALYLLWLCAAYDSNTDPEEIIEPPVPHGIADSNSFGGDLLLFFGLHPLLLVAAANGVASAPAVISANEHVSDWVKSLNDKQAKEALIQLLNGETASEKMRLLAEARDSQIPDGWPTSNMKRTFHELLEACDTLLVEEQAKESRKELAKAKREAAKHQRQRENRMKKMVDDPDKWLREADRLVDARGSNNYQAAAEILHDLCEAIGGEKGTKIARVHAAHLVKKHPTLTRLKGSLRKQGLVE